MITISAPVPAPAYPSRHWLIALVLSLLLHALTLLLFQSPSPPPLPKKQPVMDVMLLNPNETAEKLGKKSVLGQQAQRAPKPEPKTLAEKAQAASAPKTAQQQQATASQTPAQPDESKMITQLLQTKPQTEQSQAVAQTQPKPGKSSKQPSLQDLMLSSSALQQLDQQQPREQAQWGAREAEIPINTRNAKFSPYARNLIRALQDQWRPAPDNYQSLPESSKQVLLRLSIERDGSVGQVDILRPSPLQHLNMSALDAIQRAAPFKPLPSAWGLDRAKFLLTFEVVDNNFVFR